MTISNSGFSSLLPSSQDKEPYKINTGAISEAKLPAVFRVHHNARILCVMEHPTLKMRQNASILLDVQCKYLPRQAAIVKRKLQHTETKKATERKTCSSAGVVAVSSSNTTHSFLCIHPKISFHFHCTAKNTDTPSFAITRTPGFGYPLREGIEVSLKCDVDSNPPSTPVWQKDDGETPVPQTGDGFLNFSSIRREHSGWYKCTSRHLNFQYSSIGYYLSVRCKYAFLFLALINEK